MPPTSHTVTHPSGSQHPNYFNSEKTSNNVYIAYKKVGKDNRICKTIYC